MRACFVVARLGVLFLPFKYARRVKADAKFRTTQQCTRRRWMLLGKDQITLGPACIFEASPERPKSRRRPFQGTPASPRLTLK